MPLNNFGVVTPKLFRCAQPDESGAKMLIALGVKEIVKLNHDSEFSTDLERKYFPLCNVHEFDLREVFRCGEVDKQEVANIASALQFHQMHSEDAVVVHCTHGRDRTGLVIAAWRILYDGWTVEAAERERRQYGANWLTDISVDRPDVQMLKEFYKEKQANASNQS